MTLTGFDVEVIAAGEPDELQFKISEWMRKVKPKMIIHSNFVADGAEYTYCAMFVYEPQEKPLPDRKRRDRR